MAKTDTGSRTKRAGGPKADPAGPDVPFEVTTSPQFAAWLAEQRVALALTTYQAGKLFFLGLEENGRLEVFNRTLERCMGLAVAGRSLYVASLYQIWRFEDALAPGQTADGFDRVYVPQASTVTGDLDVHDIAVDAEGRLVFVNTLFSCLASDSQSHSFVPLWKPPFVSRLAAEDRCHLNGLAMRDGKPAFVTAVAQSDAADGWREARRDGGCVVDVAAGDVVARGLSMPHSPRWHRDRLWLHNSGTGELGTLDLERGRFEPVCFCPGYLRGLDFVGDFAVVATSLPRDNRAFQDLELDEALARQELEPRCGLQVVDLRSGDAPHWVRLEGAVRELYDVKVLPDCTRAMAIGFRSDEIRRVVSVGPAAKA